MRSSSLTVIDLVVSYRPLGMDVLETRPARVALEDAPSKSVSADGRTRVAYLVSKAGCGSELLLGAQWVDAGAEDVVWQAGPDVHETYYVLRGELRIAWEEGTPDAGYADLHADDSFYFPPVRRYRLSNTGSEQAFVVWSMVPPPA